MKIYIFATLVWLHTLAVSGQGVILWNESVDGLMSNSSGNPTSLGFLSMGTNVVLGGSEWQPSGPGGNILEDYFSFRVPMGMIVSDIFLTVDRPVALLLADQAFINPYGFAIRPANGSLFPQFGLLSPLSDGTYGFMIKNDDLQPFPTVANYRLDFVLSPVPEPSTWALFVLGGGTFWCFSRSRRSRS